MAALSLVSTRRRAHLLSITFPWQQATRDVSQPRSTVGIRQSNAALLNSIKDLPRASKY